MRLTSGNPRNAYVRPSAPPVKRRTLFPVIGVDVNVPGTHRTNLPVELGAEEFCIKRFVTVERPVDVKLKKVVQRYTAAKKRAESVNGFGAIVGNNGGAPVLSRLINLKVDSPSITKLNRAHTQQASSIVSTCASWTRSSWTLSTRPGGPWRITHERSLP